MNPVRIAASLILFAAGLFAGSPALAQADDDDLDDAAFQILTPAQQESNRLKILDRPPAGATQAQTEAFFLARRAMSQLQSDLTATTQFHENWIKSNPESWQANWEMAKNLSRTGNYADYFRYAQKAAALAPHAGHRAKVLSEMARRYLTWLADATLANNTISAAEAALGEFQSLSTGLGGGKGAGGGGGKGRGKGKGKSVDGDDNGGGTNRKQAYQLARLGAVVYTNKSFVQNFASQYEAAALSSTQAVAAARRGVTLGLSLGESRALFARNDLLKALIRQAENHNARGALFDADQSLRQGLDEVNRNSASAPHVSELFHSVANLRAQEGRFREAEYWARKSADVMLNANAPATSPLVVKARVIEQTAMAGQGRWVEAWAKFEALDSSVKDDPVGLKMTRNPLTRALVLLKLKRWSHAQVVLTKAWTQQKEQFGATAFNTSLTEGLLAWALWEGGQQAQATGHFNSALPGLMAPQGSAVGFEDQGLRKLARTSIAEAYLKSLGNASDTQSLERGFGVAVWLSGSTVQQALSEAAQRTRFPDPQLADALRSEQDIERELDVLYRYRNAQAGDSSARQTPEIADQMRQRIAQLSRQREELHLRIRKVFPKYDQMVRPTVPSVKEVSGLLREDEVFIQILSTSQDTYVWAIDRQKGVVGAHSELDEDGVAKLVQRLRATLDVADRGRHAPAFDFAAAVQLHDALLKPVATVLAGKSHLIVSTSGALAQVPLAALVTKEFSGPAADAPWLIRQAAISHVPGAGAWLALKQLGQGKSAGQAFMGWGDPIFDTHQVAQLGSTRKLVLTRAVVERPGDDGAGPSIKYSQIPALPETRAEVEAIADLFKADKQKDLRLGKEASRESVLQVNQNGQLAQRRVLVFATHGLVPGDLPNLRQPALAMAANGLEDADPLAPLLTLEDVLGLKLNADWVVLSACNTAAADGRAEEALSGLARGFFYAGSRSLLVTHWSVESESASLLTTGTFAHQAAHPTARRAESLREAMLAVMAKPAFSHPAFWAPYALVGEGGR